MSTEDPAAVYVTGDVQTVVVEDENGQIRVLSVGTPGPPGINGTGTPDPTNVPTGRILTTLNGAAVWAAFSAVSSINGETGDVNLDDTYEEIGVAAALVDALVSTLGSAAFASTGAFASAAQGAKADTAVQPGSLAPVATSGSYNDLTNKPSIPTVPVTSVDGETGAVDLSDKYEEIGAAAALAATLGSAAFIDADDFASAAQGARADTAVQAGDLAAVATSGRYEDLIGLPDISGFQLLAQKNQPNGYAGLDENGLLDPDVIPGGGGGSVSIPDKRVPYGGADDALTSSDTLRWIYELGNGRLIIGDGAEINDDQAATVQVIAEEYERLELLDEGFGNYDLPAGWTLPEDSSWGWYAYNGLLVNEVSPGDEYLEFTSPDVELIEGRQYRIRARIEWGDYGSWYGIRVIAGGQWMYWYPSDTVDEEIESIYTHNDPSQVIQFGLEGGANEGTVIERLWITEINEVSPFTVSVPDGNDLVLDQQGRIVESIELLDELTVHGGIYSNNDIRVRSGNALIFEDAAGDDRQAWDATSGGMRDWEGSYGDDTNNTWTSIEHPDNPDFRLAVWRPAAGGGVTSVDGETGVVDLSGTYEAIGAAAALAMSLGSAALANTSDFATAAQGAKADSAVQPADITSLVSGTGITDIVAITQTAYDALGTPDATTFYVITGA